MSLRQPFPPVSMPMVDSQGVLTLPWVQFFAALFDRTNGAQGPSAPLTGNADPAVIDSLQSQVANLSGRVTTATTDLTALGSSVSDVQMLQVLADVDATSNADQGVLLSLFLAD